MTVDQLKEYLEKKKGCRTVYILHGDEQTELEITHLAFGLEHQQEKKWDYTLDVK
jgi:hypothetical protein